MAALDAPAARAAEMIARTFAVVRIATSAKHDRSAEALLGQTLKNQIAFRAWWSGFGTSSGAHGNSMQRQELTVRGAQGAAKELVELSVPFKYRWVPDGLPGDSRYNVVQALRPHGRKHPRRQAGEPELRSGGNAPPPVGRDHASL